MQEYQDIRNLNNSLLDKQIWIEGRIHNIRSKGNLCFIILRYQNILLQSLAKKKIIGDSFKDLCKLSQESIIMLGGTLKSSPFEIKTATYNNFELDIAEWKLVSAAQSLPFLIDDANYFGETFRSDVSLSKKFDNRWLDLRTPINFNIFKIQSAICQYFREYLLVNNFIEIHTPKTISNSSEGGAEIFEIKYFDKKAYLAQSPQLYKQMAINADFDRVFEIGPIFRAEKSDTIKHLSEYTGLDLEMTLSHSKNEYEDLLKFIWGLLVFIFDNLKINYTKELESIKEIFKFEFPKYSNEICIISFSDCVELLKLDGKIQGELDDLNSANEIRLGQIIKEKFGSDLFIINKYPSNIRPFYTMPDEQEHYSKSFDIILNGFEICSGSQRINDPELLLKKINDKKINTDSLKDYIKSFTHGTKKHGGCGFGLERILFSYLNFDNIRQASFCPRDLKRINP
ncbi:Aspartyl-tRNA synthetase [uncultured virus]|nr:Aspartyl-tRNA synthetase [uncultured virus]